MSKNASAAPTSSKPAPSAPGSQAMVCEFLMEYAAACTKGRRAISYVQTAKSTTCESKAPSTNSAGTAMTPPLKGSAAAKPERKLDWGPGTKGRRAYWDPHPGLKEPQPDRPQGFGINPKSSFKEEWKPRAEIEAKLPQNFRVKMECNGTTARGNPRYEWTLFDAKNNIVEKRMCVTLMDRYKHIEIEYLSVYGRYLPKR